MAFRTNGLALAVGLFLCNAPAWSADNFYAGKTITIVVGFSPGGTYDQIARFYARNMGRFLPGNPTIIVQNMPGAGSLVAAGTLADHEPRDGTVLGEIGGAAVWDPILGYPQARYDARGFNWIGGFSRDDITCLVWHTSPIKTLQDAMKQQVIVGATGPGSRTVSLPKALNELAGTKFKIVAGYPGGSEITLALQKAEVEGYCGWALGSIRQRARDWIEQKKIRFLVQFATKSDPQLAGVPLAADLATTDEGRRIMNFLTSDATLAWTLLAPPGLPPERLALLRQAFDKMLADPAARADAAKEKLDIDPVPGAELQALVAQLAATPPKILEAIKRIDEGE